MARKALLGAAGGTDAGALGLVGGSAPQDPVRHLGCAQVGTDNMPSAAPSPNTHARRHRFPLRDKLTSRAFQPSLLPIFLLPAPRSRCWRAPPMTLSLGIGILLALACAVAANLGFFFKYRGANTAPTVSMRHPLRSAAAALLVEVVHDRDDRRVRELGRCTSPPSLSRRCPSCRSRWRRASC